MVEVSKFHPGKIMDWNRDGYQIIDTKIFSVEQWEYA
jgi:hypothetical protein